MTAEEVFASRSDKTLLVYAEPLQKMQQAFQELTGNLYYINPFAACILVIETLIFWGYSESILATPYMFKPALFSIY